MLEETKNNYLKDSAYVLNETKTYTNNGKYILGTTEELKDDNGYNYKIQLEVENGEVLGYYAIDNDDKYSTVGTFPCEDVKIEKEFKNSASIIFTEKGIESVVDLSSGYYKDIPCDDTISAKGYVTYEDFYAVGDGIHNDAYSIYYAHECANKLNLPLKINKADYYIADLPVINGRIKSIALYN